MAAGENRYSLVLLGKPEILMNGVPVKLSRAKSKGIVFYLATQNKEVSRDKLQLMFWPEFDGQTAQHNLNVHLSNIRKQLPGLIDSDSSYVRLSSNVDVDVQRFEAIAESKSAAYSSYRIVIDLYRGDFLDGLVINGSEEFDTWKQTMQEYYLNIFVDGLLKAADHYHKEGQYKEELDVLHSALQASPLQEAIYRNIMQAHYETGDLLQVNAVYQRLKKVLEEEVGVEPTSESQLLYRSMLEYSNVKDNSVHDRRKHFVMEPQNEPRESWDETAFVGMQYEMERLHDNARDGRISVLFGIDGSGRSRLMKEFSGKWPGAVLYIKGHSVSEEIPYHAFINALAELFSGNAGSEIGRQAAKKLSSKRWQMVRHLLDQAGDEPTVDWEPPDKAALYSTLVFLLKAIGSTTPMLLAVDDIETLGSHTTSLIAHLSIHCGNNVLFLLSTSPLRYRGALIETISDLRRMDKLDIIYMQGFSVDDVVQLLVNYGKGSNALYAQWLWSIAGSNPYQLIEMIKASPKVPEGENWSDFPVIPASITEYYELIKFSLSDDAKTVMNAAAVYGETFQYAVILEAGILSEQQCLDGLDELVSKTIIYPVDKKSYRFFTTIMRETIYNCISPSRKAWIHLKIAEAIENNRYLVDSEELYGLAAHHFVKSSQPARTVPYAIEAGNLAFKHAAWKDAIRYYEMAKPYSSDREFLAQYLTAAYMSAGDILSFLRLSEGNRKQAARDNEREKYLLNEIEIKFAAKEAPEEYRWGTIPAYFVPIDEEEADLISKAVSQLSEPMSDPNTRARLLTMLSLRSCAAGEFDKAIEHIMTLINNSSDFSENENSMIAMAYLAAGAYLRVQSDYKTALYILNKGIDFSRSKRIIYAESVMRCEYAKVLNISGRQNEAIRQIDLALSLSRDYRMLYIETRALYEKGIIELESNTSDAEKHFRDALNICATINNCQHLKIQIINQLYPFLDAEESAYWDEALCRMLSKEKTDN